jgi:predicted MFS family arabinose efflux permease
MMPQKDCFDLIVKRYLQCEMERESLPYDKLKVVRYITPQKIRNIFAHLYLSFSMMLLYTVPLFIVLHIGSSIIFNMFMFGLAEVLGLMLITRFSDMRLPTKAMRYNMLIMGVVAFTITFS